MNPCYTFIYLFVRIHAIDNKVSISWSNLKNEFFSHLQNAYLLTKVVTISVSPPFFFFTK